MCFYSQCLVIVCSDPPLNALGSRPQQHPERQSIKFPKCYEILDCKVPRGAKAHESRQGAGLLIVGSSCCTWSTGQGRRIVLFLSQVLTGLLLGHSAPLGMYRIRVSHSFLCFPAEK